MKILICGTGRITDELLKRIGENWQITLIDKTAAKLTPFSNRFPSVVRLLAEDASSPVALEKAGLSEQDCVLALTNEDPVNLAIVRFARQTDVKNVLSVVRNPEMLPEFQELGIWIVSLATDMARKIYQFLKDPRIRIIPLGEGEGELMELAAGKPDLPRLQDLPAQKNPDWRLAGVLRKKRLIFADDLKAVEEGDRLLILGKAELYNAFIDRLDEAGTLFPRTYGQEMILGIPSDPSIDITEVFNEAFYLAQGTHIETTKTLCERPAPGIRDTLSRWAASLQIEFLESRGDFQQGLIAAAREGNAGIVVLPYRKPSLLKAFFGKSPAEMVKRLPCPLLLAKCTDPYERLLVPFHGALSDQRALEIALDLSKQLDAQVCAVMVVEPSYLRGESASTGQWENRMRKQVRELAHIHKIKVEEKVRHGNPVKEILTIAADYQLLVLGRAPEETGFFSLTPTDMLVRKAPGSVLLVR